MKRKQDILWLINKKIARLFDFFYMPLIILKKFYYLFLIAENLFKWPQRGYQLGNTFFWFPSLLVTRGIALVDYFKFLIKLWLRKLFDVFCAINYGFSFFIFCFLTIYCHDGKLEEPLRALYVLKPKRESHRDYLCQPKRCNQNDS